jgi:hypothetical protein
VGVCGGVAVVVVVALRVGVGVPMAFLGQRVVLPLLPETGLLC